MKYTLAIIGLCLALFSCQKEPSNSLTSIQSKDSSGTKSKLLTWIKFNNSGDTGSTNFIYDSSKRLLIKQDFRAVKLYSGNYTRIVRDKDGMIEGFVQDVGSSDSLYTSLYGANGKYEYAYQLNTTEPLTLDSIAYTYTGANITSYIVYERNPPDEIYAPVSKREFTYDQNNNTTQDKWFDYDTSSKSFNLGYSYTFSYDQKVNPLNLGVESILMDFLNLSGSNNVIKENIIGGSPQDTNLITYEYTYNSDNEPVTNILIASPPGYKTTLNYIYQ